MRKHLLALGLAVVAVPSSAANINAFTRLCEAEVPVASCGCMTNELLKTRNGQVLIDAASLVGTQVDSGKALAVALANKYGLRMSQLKAIVDQSKPMLDGAYEVCK
jgi:hypothetical protein